MRPVMLLFALFALPWIVWPERLARIDEQFDAIGSTRPQSMVEPAPWKVALYRYGASAVAIGAVVWALLG